MTRREWSYASDVFLAGIVAYYLLLWIAEWFIG